jgi:twinkle protein
MTTPKTRKAAPTTKTLTLEEINAFECRGFQERDIRKNISEHYGVRVKYDADGSIISHFYPYTKKGVVVGYKERALPKTFYIHGDAKGNDLELFGQNVAHGGNVLVITEGELDALAVAQAQYNHYQRFYPSVSIPSASTTNVLLEQRSWLRQFKTVVLCFDQDEAGQAATEKAAKIIGFDKVKIAKLPEKDPCEVLIKHGPERLMKCIWDAAAFDPAGIVRGETIWDRFVERQTIQSVPYPDCLRGLNAKTRGIRQGEISLFVSGTGSGKSTVIKEIILHLLKTTDDMVGVASLEESVGDTAEKLISMQLKKNLTDCQEPLSPKTLREAYEAVFGDQRLVLLDHQGSVGDESLLEKLEHLALSGCKYLILDHITIAVSEGAEGKTGNEAIDAVMSSLLKLVKKYNIWLGVISHLRKASNMQKPFEEGRLPTIDDIKGSGSIKQISFDIIGFARNMIAENAVERNTIKLRVLKCRYTGQTGDAGATFYEYDTNRLRHTDLIDFEAED